LESKTLNVLLCRYYDAILDFLKAEELDPDFNKDYVKFRIETELKYVDVEGVRSKPLPEKCSKVAIQKQKHIMEKGMRKIAIEEIEEEVSNEENGQTLNEEFVSRIEEIVEPLKSRIEEIVEEEFKTIEIEEDEDEEEEKGISMNDILVVKEEEIEQFEKLKPFEQFEQFANLETAPKKRVFIEEIN
jgi:hypothetical protein